MSEPYLRVIAVPEGAHVLFAAQVQHWPFSSMAQYVWPSWGSDPLTDPQAQLFERQLRFVTALHPGRAQLGKKASFAVDLRYIYRPDAAHVDCVLMGKVFSPAALHTDAGAAGEDEARDLLEKVGALLPFGYFLRVAVDAAEFDEWSGNALVQQEAAKLQWAEIRRPVEFLPLSHLPVIYPFGWQAAGWEAVWLTQIRVNRPSVVSTRLCPVSLPVTEERILADYARDFEQVAAEMDIPLTAQIAESASLYTSYLASARMLYDTRISVLGAPVLQDAVCSALSHMQDLGRLNNLANISDFPSAREFESAASRRGQRYSHQSGGVNIEARADFDVGGHIVGRDITEHQHNYSLELRRFGLRLEAVCPTGDDAQIMRSNFERLEQAPWGEKKVNDPFIEDHLRYLTDNFGALCAFRLPLLPASGLPGLRVGVEVLPPTPGAVLRTESSAGQGAAPDSGAASAESA